MFSQSEDITSFQNHQKDSLDEFFEENFFTQENHQIGTHEDCEESLDSQFKFFEENFFTQENHQIDSHEDCEEFLDSQFKAPVLNSKDTNKLENTSINNSSLKSNEFKFTSWQEWYKSYLKESQEKETQCVEELNGFLPDEYWSNTIYKEVKDSMLTQEQQESKEKSLEAGELECCEEVNSIEMFKWSCNGVNMTSFIDNAEQSLEVWILGEQQSNDYSGYNRYSSNQTCESKKDFRHFIKSYSNRSKKKRFRHN